MRNYVLIFLAVNSIACALYAADPISEFEEFRKKNREHILEVTSAEVPEQGTRLVGLVFNRVEMLKRLPSPEMVGSDLQLLMFRGGSIELSDQLIADIIALPGLHYLTFDGATINGDVSALSRLRGATNLRYLRFAALGKMAAPLELFTLEQLEVIDLSGLELRRVPQSVENMKSLIVLSVSGSGVRKVDARLGSLPSLEMLLLNDNELRDLDLLGCEKLRIVDFSSNKLAEVPFGIDDLIGLNELWLFDNYLASIATDSLPRGLQRLSVSAYTKIDSETLGKRGVSVRVVK